MIDLTAWFGRSSSTAAARPIGQIHRARCQGRYCPDRSAPVWVVPGPVALCQACRDYRTSVVRKWLPVLRDGTRGLRRIERREAAWQS